MLKNGPRSGRRRCSSLRERIANQVRLMLDAALRLIREKGDSFTTQELVKEAGVALQTFYRYFATRTSCCSR